MYVVSAGVADIVDSGPVRNVFGVRQRKGIKVGPQRDHPVTTADVADHPVALGQQPWFEAGPGQLPSHQRGGLEFLPGQLRMGVNVSPDRHQFGAPRCQPTIQLAGQ